VFEQGDGIDVGYVVDTGEVDIVRHRIGGGDELVSQIAAGHYFGEPRLGGDARRHAGGKEGRERRTTSMSARPRTAPEVPPARPGAGAGR
jgi:CRP-like cAMP-binding protein